MVTKQGSPSQPCFFSDFPNIYLGSVVSKDVLKSFRNSSQSGDGTSAKKLDIRFRYSVGVKRWKCRSVKCLKMISALV